MSGHTNVAAQRQRTDSVICSSPFEAEEARPESDGKNIHAHAKETGHDEVSPFVHQDHDAQNQENSNQRIHEIDLPLLCSLAAPATLHAARCTSSLAIQRPPTYA